MSVPVEVYETKRARCLSSLQRHCVFASQSCAKHKGCIHPPLLEIELDRVVADELHLLLRITDVLLRNLILQVDMEQHRCRERSLPVTCTMQQLEDAVRSCGVCFKIWQLREPTGKPIPGHYDCTALPGGHKLRVLRGLPSKLQEVLPGGMDLTLKITTLWKVQQKL